MGSSIFDKIMKAAESEYATKVSDGNEADIETFIDTGSYSLNTLLAGSIYSGIPVGRVTALAGDPSTGKTYFSLSVVKWFQEVNPKGEVFYFETESAVTTAMLKGGGIDTNRFRLMEVATIEEFRTQATKILNAYMEIEESKRDPMFMVLDSLGGLSTNKEVSDMAEGKEVRDMSRSGLIKGAFRVITLKLSRAKVGMLVTNHVYSDIMSYGAPKVMGGGKGLQFAASTIIMLSKSKKTDTSTKEITGSIITAKNPKSRLTIENKKVEILLDNQTGLNRYWGLLELADAHGLVKRVGNKYEFADGTTAFENAIYKNPEKYFTKELLDKIDEAAKKEYRYGTTNAMVADED